MKSVNRILIVFMFLVITPMFMAAGASAPAVKWYKLTADKTYQADYTLKPGESKLLEITAGSGSSVNVGFESDITPDQSAKLEKDGVKEAIKLSTRDGKESISSTYGGATAFTAKNKKLQMKIQNRAKVPVKVVIYTEAS